MFRTIETGWIKEAIVNIYGAIIFISDQSTPPRGIFPFKYAVEDTVTDIECPRMKPNQSTMVALS